ncbi:MAG: prolipoprotein diacylglyceryl transferase family protein [bacterium]
MHQYLFQFQLPFGDRVFSIPGYGAVLFLVYLISIFYLIRVGRKVGINSFTAVLIITELVAVGILGSMVWDYIWTFALNTLGVGLGPLGGQPGLAWMGAVLGATLFGIWYIRFLKLDLLAVIDLLAPLFLFTYALGRMACLLGGCCYGAPTDLPWGITYPVGLPDYCAPGGVPLHPTPIYAALGGLLALAILLSVRRWLRKPGQMFLVALGLHSLFRSAEEAFRADHSALWLGLSVTQWFSLATALVVAYLLAKSQRFSLRQD